jgi:hypothetical protein
MEGREIAAVGEVRIEEVEGRHGDGFEQALNDALKNLDGQKWAGKELRVHLIIGIKANPGGVGHYSVELTQG